jgi:hypothetical protein
MATYVLVHGGGHVVAVLHFSDLRDVITGA